jgi:hypothetical protein
MHVISDDDFNTPDPYDLIPDKDAF